MNRDEILGRVRRHEKPWDILIIGGGATGVGCAVDAASRGFDVLLLEQSDFGKGTSSRSTKLVHGGVRYLAQGNISLVREALKERGLLLRNAPETVRKMEFVVPCYSLWDKLFYGTGLKIYDVLAGKYSFGRSRLLSREETLERLPNIKSHGLKGGILYYDGQFDDARLLIDLVVTAADRGAAMLNYAPVRSLIKDEKGKIAGVTFEDAETGEMSHAHARAVINATGAFCEAVRKLSDENARDLVTLSQGVHLVFDKSFLPGDAALMIPKTSDGRVLFAIPWHGRTLVGTTETPIDTPELDPKATENEIDFILATAAVYLARPPRGEDILSIFTGIRPLVRSSDSRNTAALSRGHTIEIDSAGLLTITGGKWTTYRHMAEDAVDRALSLAGLEKRACVTESLKIAAPRAPSADEAPLHPRLPYTRADVLRSVRVEMARTVEDVLARRTRALLLDARAAVEISGTVAEIMSEELRKDKDWADRQTGEFKGLAKLYSLD